VGIESQTSDRDEWQDDVKNIEHQSFSHSLHLPVHLQFASGGESSTWGSGMTAWELNVGPQTQY
jgi:hypothetical protein